MSPVPRSKVMPRFERPGRGRGADEVVRPVPPLLLKLAAEREEVARHENLAARYVEARTRLVALGSKLEEARRLDLAEERAAAETGRKKKVEKAPKVEHEIEEARREVEVLAELIEESAVALLRAVVPYLAAADEEASAKVEAALTEARDAIVAAQHRFEEAATLAGEADWIVMLRRTGTTYPWTGGKGAERTPRAAALVREAITAYDYDREQRTRNLAKRDEEEAVEAKLPLSPGSVVWRGGETFIAGEDGELKPVEVEEVGRE